MKFKIKELKEFAFTSTFMSCYLTCWAAVLLVKVKFAIAYFCWRHIISAMLDRHSFVNLPSVYFDACDFVFSLNSISQWCSLFQLHLKTKLQSFFSSSLSLPSRIFLVHQSCVLQWFVFWRRLNLYFLDTDLLYLHRKCLCPGSLQLIILQFSSWGLYLVGHDHCWHVYIHLLGLLGGLHNGNVSFHSPRG